MQYFLAMCLCCGQGNRGACLPAIQVRQAPGLGRLAAPSPAGASARANSFHLNLQFHFLFETELVTVADT